LAYLEAVLRLADQQASADEDEGLFNDPSASVELAEAGIMSQHTSEDGLLLPGLDGTNPLGFLAALGGASHSYTATDASKAVMAIVEWYLATKVVRGSSALV
jgi:hypothetical protein